MRLIGHSDLGGFANGGEGIGLQKTRDGRRIMYIAHECAPINFTVVDVSDPSKPQVVTQTKLPHNEVRSNSLDLVGDTLAVAYQTQKTGLTTGGCGAVRRQRSGQSALHFLLRSLGSTLPGVALRGIRGRRIHAHQ